jgi:hypothetical protein
MARHSGRPDALATLAAELGLTELELVTEARRQAVEALERRTTEHARARTAGLIDELDGWLAKSGKQQRGRGQLRPPQIHLRSEHDPTHAVTSYRD